MFLMSVGLLMMFVVCCVLVCVMFLGLFWSLGRSSARDVSVNAGVVLRIVCVFVSLCVFEVMNVMFIVVCDVMM